MQGHTGGTQLRSGHDGISQEGSLPGGQEIAVQGCLPRGESLG